jgi:ankyrin repeat protein
VGKGAKTSDGQTAQHLAVNLGRDDLVKNLLNKGLDATSTDDYVRSTLRLAVQKVNFWLVANDRYTSNGIDATDNSGRTPLRYVTDISIDTLRAFESLSFLLSKNPRLNVLDKSRWTPLHCAVLPSLLVDQCSVIVSSPGLSSLLTSWVALFWDPRVQNWTTTDCRVELTKLKRDGREGQGMIIQ